MGCAPKRPAKCMRMHLLTIFPSPRWTDAYRTVISGNTLGYSGGYAHDRMTSVCLEQRTWLFSLFYGTYWKDGNYKLVTLSMPAVSIFCLIRNWGLDCGGVSVDAVPSTYSLSSARASWSVISSSSWVGNMLVSSSISASRDSAQSKLDILVKKKSPEVSSHCVKRLSVSIRIQRRLCYYAQILSSGQLNA